MLLRGIPKYTISYLREGSLFIIDLLLKSRLIDCGYMALFLKELDKFLVKK